MRYTTVFLFLLTLFLYGCEAKEEEDHSALDEMVLLDKEEEDASLITDAGAPGAQLAPQEIIIQEETKK